MRFYHLFDKKNERVGNSEALEMGQEITPFAIKLNSQPM